MFLLVLISTGMDLNSLRTSNDNPICKTHAVPPSTKTYDCDNGGYLAVVLLDVYLFLAWGSMATFSFFYSRKGWFASEISGEQEHVDYFGEAERYFPSDHADDGDSLTGGTN